MALVSVRKGGPGRQMRVREMGQVGNVLGDVGDNTRRLCVIYKPRGWMLIRWQVVDSARQGGFRSAFGYWCFGQGCRGRGLREGWRGAAHILRLALSVTGAWILLLLMCAWILLLLGCACVGRFVQGRSERRRPGLGGRPLSCIGLGSKAGLRCSARLVARGARRRTPSRRGVRVAHGEMQSRWRNECTSELAILMREAVPRERLSPDWISGASRKMEMSKTGGGLGLRARRDVHGRRLMIVDGVFRAETDFSVSSAGAIDVFVNRGRWRSIKILPARISCLVMPEGSEDGGRRGKSR